MKYYNSFGRQFVLLLLILTHLACNQTTEAQKDTNLDAEDSTITEKESFESKVEWLNGIPIYKNFEDLAPIFALETDTTYIINFWATWCKPCVEELPYFEALHEEFMDQKIRVILVSLDFPKQLESKLIPFIDKHQLKSDVMVLTDPKQNDWIDKVSQDWGGAIPITLIYNQQKKEFISEQFAGPKELNALVESFL